MTDAIQNIKKQVARLLEKEELTPIKDGGGVYTPIGVEAGMRAQAYRICLSVIEQEEAINLNP